MDKELRNRVSERISKQKGQNYPCSNQIMLCGFFSNLETWNKFCEDNNDNIKYRTQSDVVFQNGERWHWLDISYSCRGYRFYKIKVCSEIDESMFFESIYPYCSLYCKEIEWI